ncbi:MAG: protein kinase [Actinomycetota bacterium]|nr:protein kinase [Actinomycetota bacterium]
MVGELIAGRYELEELVGTGGMSSVYRAHDRLLERQVALKVLHEQLTADGEHVERFRREARAVAQLSHPNIVTVIDRGEQDDRQYIVFEYVDGENLKALLEREGPLPERQAIGLALQIARALGFAHGQGLVHRDVKPQNVLLNDGGQAKVTDFGIARSLDVHSGLTQTGTVMGTSDYIAPEQARGSRVDAQSDIYSLGAVLYELLTCEVPFPGDNFVAVAMRHINEPPPSVRERRLELSPCVDAVIRRAMAKEPRDRFRSMDELCAELDGCLAELEGNGVSPGAQTMVVSPQRRRRKSRPARPPAERPSVWPLIMLLAGLAILAGILAAVFTFTDSTQKLREAIGGNGGGGVAKAVPLSAVAAYDPFGDQHEHDEDIPLAADADATTFWTTEHYSNFTKTKDGVGIVVDAGSAQKLSKLTVVSDKSGFTAEIRSGSSSTGPFTTTVSDSQTVGGHTTFNLHGGAAQYYLVWITDLGGNDAVHVNEVTARSG